MLQPSAVWAAAAGRTRRVRSSRGLVPRIAKVLAASAALAALGRGCAGAAWQVPARQNTLLPPSLLAGEQRAPRRSAATALAEWSPLAPVRPQESGSRTIAAEEAPGRSEKTMAAGSGLSPAEERRLQWVEARLCALNAWHEKVVARQDVLFKEWEAVAVRRKQPA
mmetsp:Transcript_102946/g.320807  ORF Transcript_102946/g.320807 Transcript_102946/m.320807 type:complete len:166 (-) Transcript_102946:329-826(-)